MKLCVINLRGLGAGHTGPYGNRWIDTPSLNALASQAVVFDVHLAAHPDPDSARGCWRTGCHRFPGAEPATAEGWPDLLAALRGAGVGTTLLADRGRPSPATFEAGWDEVRGANGLGAVVAAGRDAVAALTRRERGLLWIELASLLPPWDVADEFLDPYFTPAPPAGEEEVEGQGEEDEPIEPLLDPPAGPIYPDDDLLLDVIQTTYAAAVSQADAALADLLDGLPDDVAVLVTSDHGQALGERGFVGPGRAFLHREIVQVPLILGLAGRPLRRRVPELTLSIDIAPTIAELFGLELPGAHGRSLLPLAGLDSVPWRDYVCLGGRAGDEVEWGLWTGDWALRLPRIGEAVPRLYVRPDDRAEVNDLYQHHVETGEALERTLRAYAAACARPGPLAAPPLEQPDAP